MKTKTTIDVCDVIKPALSRTQCEMIATWARERYRKQIRQGRSGIRERHELDSQHFGRLESLARVERTICNAIDQTSLLPATVEQHAEAQRGERKIYAPPNKKARE